MATHVGSSRTASLVRSAWILVSLAIVAVSVFYSISVMYAAEPVQFPSDFRRWVHVGTGVILPGANAQLKSEEGMHHVFANPKAVEGYASGNFTEGSMIVYELRDAKQQNGVISEGDRKRVDVMIKDSSRYASTGGWRFERFWGDDRTKDAIDDSGKSCFDCHSNAKAHGLVFSQLH